MGEYYFFSWLLKDGTVFGFLKRLIIGILILVLSVAYGLGFFYSLEKFALKKDLQAILVTMETYKSVSALILSILIMLMIFIVIQAKIDLILFNKRDKKVKQWIVGSIRDNTLEEKFKIKKIACLILGSLCGIMIIYMANNHIAIYEDKIIINNIIPALEKEYDFNDIKKVDLNIKHTQKYDTFKYKIILKNDKKISLSNGDLKDLISLNKIIKDKEIKREIDDKYLEVLIVDYQESEQEKYRELFR